MSRSYIDPRYMDRVLGRPLNIQAIWHILLMHRSGQQVPGLVLVDREQLVAQLKVRDGSVESGIDGLKSAGLIKEDIDVALIRIPLAPDFFPTPGPDNLRGWWRHWQTMPESRLKYEHVESLRRAAKLKDKAPIVDVWQKTFGTLSAEDVSIHPQGSLNLPLFNQTDRPPVDRGSTPADPDLDLDQDREKEQDPLRGVQRGEEPHRKLIPLPTFRMGEGTSPGRDMPDGVLARARTLWERQEDLRAALALGPRLPATDANLELVVACLEATGYGDDLALHALEVFAANASSDPDAKRWFNGSTNWKPQIFKQNAGTSLPGTSHKGGHFKVKGSEKYGDGKSVVTRKH